jgi:transposase-like protein
MVDRPEIVGASEVICPHCKKPFVAEPIGTGAGPQGFKCPHCRLFVPAERTGRNGSE